MREQRDDPRRRKRPAGEDDTVLLDGGIGSPDKVDQESVNVAATIMHKLRHGHCAVIRFVLGAVDEIPVRFGIRSSSGIAPTVHQDHPTAFLSSEW